MIDESCKVPRENLDDGFNPCRKQVVENGELCQYAHMYDVMNERYDREEDTSYLDSVKRDKITSTTPVLLAGNNTRIYANSTNSEGFVNMLPSSAFNNPSNHTEASIPSAKAVADYVTANIPDISALEAEIEGKLDKVSSTYVVDRLYGVAPNGTQFMKHISSESENIVSGHKDLQTAGSIADYAPIPLPISKGGTGGNTPYVTDDLDSSAVFVMHDAPNDRYGAAPMSSLTGYLDGRYETSAPTHLLANGTDLDDVTDYGSYYTLNSSDTSTLVNIPEGINNSVRVDVFSNGNPGTTSQILSDLGEGTTWYRVYNINMLWSAWTLLYPTSAPTVPNPLPVDQGGTGAQTRRLKTAAGLTLLPVIDSIGASGALNGYTSVTNIATFITSNNIRPEITTAFENHIADAVAHNDLLPTNALMMDYVDGSLINYNSITVSGGGTSNLVYNKVRLKNNRIYGDCDFTVDSEGEDGGVKVNIKINGTDINISPVFTKFILSNKPILVHKSSNTIIEGKNIYDITDGTVYIQFNIGDFNTGEFIFIVDSVFTGYNQPM